MINSIEVRNAVKYYGNGENRNKVLDGLNMNVKPGSIYSLIGASGCGKTTLLSSILGMKKLNQGTIKVLGHEVTYEKPTKVGHLIGYMPQNTALIPELTIREILHYFGNIFQMDKELLAERYKMVKELLELPVDSRRVENLSGGQQRRVSIAASIIHNPLILILDEPTVGLDSLLRDKIWTFLLDATRTSKLAIVITTHYISEAEKSDRCGLMRDGQLLSEDSPKSIMARSGTISLDEAFLNLCLMKQNLEDIGCNNELLSITQDAAEELCFDENAGTVESFEKRKKFSRQTIRALVVKEFIRITRQKAEIFFTLVLPILQMLAFAYAIGDNPAGLKIGIVNFEEPDNMKCLNYLSKNSSYLDIYGECIYSDKTSCYLLDEIHDDDAIKVFYSDYDTALADAKSAKLAGIITLSRNFTTLMENPAEGHKTSTSYYPITVQLDQSNFHISMFLQYRLYRAYQRFNKKLLNGCGRNEKVAEVPMNFDDTYFGSLENDFKATMFAPLIMQSLLFPAMGFSCFSISQNRIDGVWNRTLLSGTKPIEILITQVIISVIVVIISFIETIITALLTIDIVMIGELYLIFVFGALMCLTGSIFGIAMSSLSENIKFTSMFLFAFVQLLTTLCGSFWPLEGQPTILRYFSYCLPTTIPPISVRDVMLKGFGITMPSVYIGLVILLIWIIVSLFSALIVMKKRKFADI